MGSRRAQKTEKSMIQNLYWKQVFQSPKTKIGFIIVIIFAVAAILAPVLAPHDPLLVDVTIKLKGPSAAYPLGTDQSCHDSKKTDIHGKCRKNRNTSGISSDYRDDF